MLYHFAYLILIWAITLSANVPMFFLNSKNLHNKEFVQEKLIQLGFKKVYFSTTDNIQLCGLLLDQSKTKKIYGTVIYCAGFYPGTKEGMSSFASMLLDQPYNILLFDARGHNESAGTFLSYQDLQQYGTVEYRDIIAAVTYIHTYTKLHNISTDIIIHGICSGAFHTMKAYETIMHQSPQEAACIKGIIFDSGWLHIQDIAHSTISAEVHKKLKHSYFAWLQKPLINILQNIYDLFLKPFHAQQLSIEKIIQQITIPIWFVHCINDPYIPLNPIQQCVQKCDHKNYWWIDDHGHATYHMKNHHAYQQQLMSFLNCIRQTSN